MGSLAEELTEVEFREGGMENVGEGGLFGGSKMTEDEIDIAELLADGGVVRAETETGEILGAEAGGDGFQAVIAAAGAFDAETGFAERQVEIVANDRNMLGWNFVILCESLHSFAGVIIKNLGFEKNGIVGFVPEGVIFRLFPVKMMDFRIKIQEEKAEVVAGEVVFWAGITESDDKIHKIIVQYIDFYDKV